MNYREELTKARNRLRGNYERFRQIINHPKLWNIVKWEDGKAVIKYEYALPRLIPALRKIVELQKLMRTEAMLLLELENAIEHEEGKQ